MAVLKTVLKTVIIKKLHYTLTLEFSMVGLSMNSAPRDFIEIIFILAVGSTAASFGLI